MDNYFVLNAAPPFTLYHDGHCPLCQVEINYLKRHPYREHVKLVDIQSSDFNAEETDRSFDELMGQLHLKDRNGQW